MSCSCLAARSDAHWHPGKRFTCQTCCTEWRWDGVAGHDVEKTAAPKGEPGPVAGRKADAGKPRWDLLPHLAAAAVVRVLTFGAERYAPDGWLSVPNARTRYYAAALRHLTAWWLGEKRDPETGESHLAHAACCVLFLLDVEETP